MREQELHAGGSCPECGTACGAGVKYCANCGASLSGLIADLAARDQLAPGTVVGSYRLLELLGEGGMGRVYVAEHVKLGRRVAVKMLRAEFAQNPVAISRFFAEARAVNRISHENIVEITDFLEKPGGHNCYIMELLHGEDLGIRLLRDEPITVTVAVEIAAQIAGALHAVHQAGIVHRDLKPDNVFLIERGGSRNFVKLLDFGVAKLTDASATGLSTHSTAQGQIIGTPEYMSPEQAGGQAIDHRTDIYALGVVLYELITGEIPFKAKNFGELVIKHMTVPPKPPKQVAKAPDAIPDALEALVLELLAKDPSERPQTMAEVEARLHAIHETLDVPVQPRRFMLSGSMPRLPKPVAAPAPERFDATAPTLDAAPAALMAPQPSVRIKVPTPEPLRAPHAPRLRRGRARLIAIGGAVAAVALGGILWTTTRGDSHAELAAVAPPVAPVTPAPAPAAPAPGAPDVQVKFVSTPAGATVKLGARTLGVTPFVAALPRGTAPVTVEIAKAGYVATTESVSVATDALVTTTLVSVPAVAQRKPPATPMIPTRIKPPQKPANQKAKPLDRGGTMDVFAQ